MTAFGQRSLLNLSTCHPDLARVAARAIAGGFDFAVICGHRGRAEQEAAFAQGVSRAHWLQSPHNFTPSLAFDAVPWPLNWEDVTAFNHLGDVIKAAAQAVGVGLTWGGDFGSFKDRPHFELTNWRTIAKTQERAA